MGPSSFLVASERERSVAYGKCMNVQDDNVGLSCSYGRIYRICLVVGVWFNQSEGSSQLFFQIWQIYPPLYVCAWSLIMCSSWSLIFEYVPVLPQADIVGFDSVGRQSSQLWKPAAPPLKRSWHIHGSSLVWSKQKFGKKTWVVIQLQLWEK
jgi:hypothetical protein